MARLRRLLARSRSLFRNDRAENELAREIVSHLALLAEEFERRGMSPNEARLAAKREYGGVEQAKQAHRDERSFLWIEQAVQDLRYAMRMLAKVARLRRRCHPHPCARDRRQYRDLQRD